LHFVTKHFKNIKKQSQPLKFTSKYVNLLLVTMKTLLSTMLDTRVTR